MDEMPHFASFNTTDSTTGNVALAGNAVLNLGLLRADLATHITGTVFTDQSGTLYVDQSFDVPNPNEGAALLTTALTTGGGPITSLAISKLSVALPVGTTIVLTTANPGAPLNGASQSFALSSAAAAAATSLAVTSTTPTFAFPVGTSVTALNFDSSASTACTVSSAGVGQSFTFDVTILAPVIQLRYINGSSAQGFMRLFARTLYQGR